MSKIGIIYKLVSTDINIKEIYVGSTINFRTRKCHHKTACNNQKDKRYNFNVYKYIRANGGFSSFDMIQIEEVKHDTKQQLHTRERYWIEELKATLNKIIPTRTKTEYYTCNLDSCKQTKAKYYQNNKEILNIKHAEYYEDNKDAIKLKKAEYYEGNKEIIKNKQAKKYDCECGSTLRIGDKAQHEKSKKHKNWLSTQ